MSVDPSMGRAYKNLIRKSLKMLLETRALFLGFPHWQAGGRETHSLTCSPFNFQNYNSNKSLPGVPEKGRNVSGDFVSFESLKTLLACIIGQFE